jgi:hypothetical protein
MRLNSIFSRIVIAIFFSLFIPACDQAGTPQGEYQPRWQKMVDTNPLDGSKDIQMLMGTVNRLPSQKDQVILVLTCTQGATNAYVVWRRYLGVYDPEVTWRVGSDPSVSETWVLSTDNEATFAPEPVELIKRMMTNDMFLIKTTPFGSAPVTTAFNTAGLKTEIAELRETCAW